MCSSLHVPKSLTQVYFKTNKLSLFIDTAAGFTLKLNRENIKISLFVDKCCPNFIYFNLF